MWQIICDVCGKVVPDGYECRHLSITDKNGKFERNGITNEFGSYTIGDIDLCKNCAKKIIEQCGYVFSNDGVARKTKMKKPHHTYTISKSSKPMFKTWMSNNTKSHELKENAICSWTKLPCSYCIPSGCNFRMYR